MSLRLDVTDTPDPASIDGIGNGLADFNTSSLGPSGRRVLAVRIPADDGTAPGGGLHGTPPGAGFSRNGCGCRKP